MTTRPDKTSAQKQIEYRALRISNETPEQTQTRKQKQNESTDKSRAKQQASFTPQQKIEHNKKLADQKRNQRSIKSRNRHLTEKVRSVIFLFLYSFLFILQILNYLCLYFSLHVAAGN